MKTDKRILDVVSTIQGEKVQMGIDSEALGHIMSILTDLYSDPEMAVIREYSTNALDAHVEAGVTRPIEVTLPSNLSPYLKIRDYGYGLNAEGIRDIYSRYGTSTKRHTNDAVGMLGLGCKSALTYADQFTLTGIKDGFAIQVAISRDEDGSGSMTIVNEYETLDPSGVEIVIPVKVHNNFQQKAASFFRFWKDGNVLVNGCEPERIDGLYITPDLLLTTEVDEDMVVMGNVAYPTGNITERGYGSKYAIVAFVDIGSVNFTPSREALQMTTKTKAALAVLSDRVKKEKTVALNKLINEAPTKWDAIPIVAKATQMGLSRKDATYKGETVPQYHTVEIKTKTTSGVDTTTHLPMIRVVQARHRYRGYKGWEKTTAFDTSQQQTLWFDGYESEAFTPHKKAKLDQWAQNAIASGKISAEPEHYVFTKEIGARDWIDPARIFTWEEVNEEKITRTNVSRRDGRPTGSYEGIVAGKWQSVIEAGDIDLTNPLYWLPKNGEDRWSNPDGLPVIKEEESDATVIYLGANRVAKFQRDFPHVKKVIVRVRELADSWVKGLTDEDKIWLSMKNNSQCGILTKLDEPNVLDPDLKKAIQACTTNKEALYKKQQMYRYWTENTLKLEKADPLSAYPLLTSLSMYGTVSGEFKNHMTMYVNAVYTASQNKEV